MKLTVALTIILVVGTIADNEEAKEDVVLKSADMEVKSADVEVKSADVEVKNAHVEVKSADTEVKRADAEVKSADVEAEAKQAGQNNEAESYTVPVEVVRDATSEGEVRSADLDHKDERVERSSSDVTQLTFAVDVNDKLLSESETFSNRRSNDEAPAINEDEPLVKSVPSNDSQVSEAKPDDAEDARQGEEQKDAVVRSAAAAEQVETDERHAEYEEDVSEKYLDAEDLNPFVPEGVETLTIDTRRMPSPVGTYLDTKAREGYSGERDALNERAFGSFRPRPSKAVPSPLMALPTNDYLLKPALPLRPPFLGFTNRATFEPVSKLFQNNPLPTDLNFKSLTPQQIPQLPPTPPNPVPYLSNVPRLSNVPQSPKHLNFDQLLKNPTENFRPQNGYNQFANNLNKPLQYAYSIPSYLGYNPQQ